MSAARVLLALRDGAVGLALGSELRRRGQRVSTVDNGSDALRLAAHDLVVLDAALAGADWTGLARALLCARPGTALVLLADAPTFEDCRTALRLGLRDVLTRSCGVEAIVDSLERALAAHRAGDSTEKLVLRHVADADGLDAAVRELLAQLVRWSFGPSARARIAAAVHELLDNVLRHAYPGREGAFELRAELEARELVVEVADQGIGTEPTAKLRGLARVAALAEDLRLDSAPQRGTRARVRFAAWRAQFEEESGVDLSELDYLTPELATRVLAGLTGVEECAYDLSPALAVSVGRLLAGPTEKQLARAGLWS